MLHRIVTGIAALLIGTLAIGLPIMLTEAGTSTSTNYDRTLNASFEYTDPATGDQYYGTIYASLSEYRNRTNDNGGGNGGGGSGRAKSLRPRGGNSDRPSGGGGTQTWTSNYINVYMDRYNSDGQWVAELYGYSSNGTIIIAGDLSSGSVVGTLAADIYRPDDTYDTGTVSVNLNFAATGALVTSRERYSEHIKSPRQRYVSMTTTARRPAAATGSMTAPPAFTGNGGLNVAQNGAYYAQIATYDNKSRSSY